MGFKRGKTTYKLTFADPEYADPVTGDALVVKTSSVDLGQYMDILELIDRPMTRENITALFGQFAEFLVEWNVEDDDGEPVPTTVAGLMSLDLPFVQMIIEAWRDEMERVATPLGPSSSGGGQSEAVSIPMETLSANRAS